MNNSTVVFEHRLAFSTGLTKQEIACLLLAAKGKSLPETAETLGIKVCTVATYRRQIKRKLACSTMAQAVFEGIRFGYMQSANSKIQ